MTYRKIVNFLGSRKFFALLLIIFGVEAAWIALTARYPQAFDEQSHLGIIQLYAHQWSPFFAHQPSGADVYGALTRDPSYLYHYLMSFPWRLITHLTHSFTAQVIIMRFLNIILFGSSFFMFRKVLGYTPASKALIQVSLLFLALTPVVPLLASQINYDNMFIPLSGLAVLWCLRFVRAFREQQRIQFDILAQLAVICLLGSLVKYAFLPIFAAIFVIITIILWRARSDQLRSMLSQGWRAISRVQRVVYAAILLVSIGLFTQIYAINILRYHTPVPECDQVLSVKECAGYAPWLRNYDIVQSKTTPPFWQEVTYSFDWLYHSMGELIFTISSSFNTMGTVDYYVGTQTIAVEVLAWSIFGIGVLVSLLYAKYIWRNETLRLFVVIIGVYVFALWAQNYEDYLHTGQPLAIHGRYLLPILPLVYVIVALAVRKLLQARRIMSGVSFSTRKVTLAAIVLVVLCTQGGGSLTYIVRSDPSWFWPQSTAAQRVNAKAKKILNPVILGD